MTKNDDNLAITIKEAINLSFNSENYALENLIVKNIEAKKKIIELIKNGDLTNNQLRIVIKQALPYVRYEDYLPILLFLLSNNELPKELHYEIIQKIAWLGDEASNAQSLLLEKLERNEYLKGISAIALAEIGCNDKSILSYIIEVLESDSSYSQRLNAVRILQKDYLNDEEVLTKLMNRMEKDSDFRVRQKIAFYLRNCRNEMSKTSLLKISTSDRHPLVRSVAKDSLEKMI